MYICICLIAPYEQDFMIIIIILIFPLFQYFKLLKNHIENMHSTVDAFKCNLCDYSHSTNWGLKQHINNNHGNRNGRAGKCNLCGNVS